MKPPQNMRIRAEKYAFLMSAADESLLTPRTSYGFFDAAQSGADE